MQKGMKNLEIRKFNVTLSPCLRSSDILRLEMSAFHGMVWRE